MLLSLKKMKVLILKLQLRIRNFMFSIHFIVIKLEFRLNRMQTVSTGHVIVAATGVWTECKAH